MGESACGEARDYGHLKFRGRRETRVIGGLSGVRNGDDGEAVGGVRRENGGKK
jgi:hypothetical protein